MAQQWQVAMKLSKWNKNTHILKAEQPVPHNYTINKKRWGGKRHLYTFTSVKFKTINFAHLLKRKINTKPESGMASKERGYECINSAQVSKN